MNQPLLTTSLFNPKPSQISEAGGPTALEQVNALARNQSWAVLGVECFNKNIVTNDKRLCREVNAMKHALETFGPKDANNLPDFQQNEGKTKGDIFHGHVKDSNGTMHVIEWEVLDEEKRIMMIVGFKTHENYGFKKNKYGKEEKSNILNNPETIKRLDKIDISRSLVQAKAKRINQSAKH